MDHKDETTDEGTERRAAAATRRTVLSVAAVGGPYAMFAGVHRSTDQESARIELGGETPGWVGRAPADIEGETNPTLTLTAGETYELVWENVDGAPHNVVIVDGEGSELVRSEIISEQGTTQTVEFTASEEMAEYYCEVHPNTMHGDVAVEAETTAESAVETSEGETDEEEEELERPTFDPDVVEEHQGDVATIAVSLGDYDRCDVVIGSQELNYKVGFTAIDGVAAEEDGDGQGGEDAASGDGAGDGGDEEQAGSDGQQDSSDGQQDGSDSGQDDGDAVEADGVVKIAFDSFVAGRGDESGIRAVNEGDRIRNYEHATPELPSPLDPTAYPLEAYVEGELTAYGALLLQPRETVDATPGVAPDGSSPSSSDDFPDHVTRREEVATGDWAVVEVEASGLYATLDDISAFDDESLGYELNIVRTDVPNRRDTIPLEEVSVVTDAENDRFFVVADTDSLQIGAVYETMFTITDANPYVPDGESESVSTSFTVVERSVSFDIDGDALTVPPSETELTGTASVAPGTPLTVMVASTQEIHLREAVQTTVEEDGTWAATVDFSRYVPGMRFVATVPELDARVEGEVVSGE
ncbi:MULTISPECIES: BGTF surface domain-containing protein [Halostella]|uniref:cupredoxin domain-containing protein n=1 Tax=Halostella TaxID=1843185 RepID=UPI001964ABFE|nr:MULTISPECIES: BGTF surface domain-containing protein [Halostella]